MQEVDLVGPRIRLRRSRVTDAEATFRWFANATVTEYLPLAGERVLPMDDIVRFLQQASRDDAPNLQLAIELSSGRLIGCGGLRNIVPASSAEISLVIGEPDVWGAGYGQEAMRLILQFGFEQLQLALIWLIVRTDNARALGLFRGFGFTVVETLDPVVVRGVERTKYRMQLAKAP